ncbi:hypothetical protein BDF14DRAFT_1882837 [Spinellus fusiger]|nr:hypothetical protein BDF14DRAFT_1882837 [Spinellus fusiger]
MSSAPIQKYNYSTLSIAASLVLFHLTIFPFVSMLKDPPKDQLLGLHWAATTGNVGLIKFALDHGVPIDSVINGFMPLQLACLSDTNVAAVQYLIDRGAGVNAQRWSKKHSSDKSQAVAGATGSTALHVACANGCLRNADILLRNGASPDIKDKYGSTPIDIATAKNYVDILQLLKVSRKRAHSLHTQHTAPHILERTRRPSLPIMHGREKPLPCLPSSVQSTPLSSLLQMRPSVSHSHSSTHSHSSMHSHSHSHSYTPSHSHSCSCSYPPTHPLPLHPHPTHHETPTHSLVPIPARPIPRPTPELSSSESSKESSAGGYDELGSSEHQSSPTFTHKHSQERTSKDWYSYGVLHSYQEDNYLSSLERRACEKTPFSRETSLTGDTTPFPHPYRRSWWAETRRSMETIRHSLDLKSSLRRPLSGYELQQVQKKPSFLPRWVTWPFKGKREE